MMILRTGYLKSFVWENKMEISDYEVAVIGAGHAGCEAALACARLNKKTIVFTVSINSIKRKNLRQLWLM